MNWSQPKVYAVKHKDEEIRAASRSGGIFTALSDLVLDDGGVSKGVLARRLKTRRTFCRSSFVPLVS